MIAGFLPSLKAGAREIGTLARGILRRAALMSAAGLIGAVGCGFVVFAGFAALRLVIGPELSALAVGVALLALAALLAWLSSTPGAEPLAKEDDTPPLKPSAPPVQPADPATLAVFTAAFVLGRRLADRRPD